MMSVFIHLTTMIFFCHVIGLSFIDLSNTSRDKEFPQDACSWCLEGSGDTMLLHNDVGFLELPFAVYAEYFCNLN
jgi:hypothetical protein